MHWPVYEEQIKRFKIVITYIQNQKLLFAFFKTSQYSVALAESLCW